MEEHYQSLKLLTRDFKRFVSQYNDLRDWGSSDATQFTRWSDADLEWMRCHKLPFVEKENYKGKTYSIYNKEPTYIDFASHFDRDFPFTLFVTNSCGSEDVLLLLADIDNKSGDGDVDIAVDHMIRQYGFTSCYVEPSTELKGAHAYFLLDTATKWFDLQRDDVWLTMAAFADRIRSDSIWEKSKVKFDGFFGLPTLWNSSGKITRRGNLLKLPRLLNGHADLAKLKALKPMSFVKLQKALGTEHHPKTSPPLPFLETTLSLQGVLGRTMKQSKSPRPFPSAKSRVRNLDLNGYEKRKLCISECLITSNGKCTLERVYDHYMAHWGPIATKCPQERRNQLAAQLKGMKKKFRPSVDQRKHPFRSGEYLEQVKQIVPLSAYGWKRREKLTPEKLADFISIKVADAFHPNRKGWFGQTCRDTSIVNSRTLKRQGKMDWIITPNLYRKLLEITVEYKLLHVYEPHRRPVIDPVANRKLANGKPRLIGPGDALASLKAEWLPLYRRYQQEGMLKVA